MGRMATPSFCFWCLIIHKNALVKEKKDLLDLFLTATEENVNSFRKSPKTAIETWLKIIQFNYQPEPFSLIMIL